MPYILVTYRTDLGWSAEFFEGENRKEVAYGRAVELFTQFEEVIMIEGKACARWCLPGLKEVPVVA